MFHKLAKRELAAYYLLLSSGASELGEAIDLLSTELCMTRRTARNIIKRLSRLGLLELARSDQTIRLSVRSPEEVLREAFEAIRSFRRERCQALSKRTPGEGGE